MTPTPQVAGVSPGCSVPMQLPPSVPGRAAECVRTWGTRGEVQAPGFSLAGPASSLCNCLTNTYMQLKVLRLEELKQDFPVGSVAGASPLYSKTSPFSSSLKAASEAEVDVSLLSHTEVTPGLLAPAAAAAPRSPKGCVLENWAFLLTGLFCFVSPQVFSLSSEMKFYEGVCLIEVSWLP